MSAWIFQYKATLPVDVRNAWLFCINRALSDVLDGLALADMVERSEMARARAANVLDFSI